MTTGRKLFGTDGVRGEAGTFLTAELATALGRAATASLEAERPQVLIVRDTRESGPMLESALAAGIAAAGGDALLGGVLPTPAAAILVKRLGLDLAAVVSASHNPYRDNGIKFFSGLGTKLDDEAEARIEALLDAERAAAEPGHVRELNGGLEDYLRALQAAFPLDLSGQHVMLDCANGATFRAAPAIFERLGATVETIGTEPDGRNINDGCGSTHLDRIAEAIAASEATIGFAFDGDGDRVLAVDGSGRTPRRRRADRPGGARDGEPRRAGRRRRRHRDEQLRLPPGDGGGRHRGCGDPGRRPLRARRAARAGLGARRRAVGPHHRHPHRRHRRRHRRGAGDDARARRAATSPRWRRWRSCRRPWSTSRSPIARQSPAPSRSGRRSSARRRRWRAAAGCSCAPRAPSRWCG